MAKGTAATSALQHTNREGFLSVANSAGLEESQNISVFETQNGHFIQNLGLPTKQQKTFSKSRFLSASIDDTNK